MNHASAGQDAGVDPRRALAALLPELRVFGRFLSGSREEGDDLVQEAVLRTLRALEEGRLPATLTAAVPGGDATRPGAALRPWCLAVIRNVFHEQRRARRREAAHRQTGVLAAEQVVPPAPQDGHGEMQDLTRGLAALPPLLREALILVGAQGLSHEEAAEVCGVPVGTMKARVSRARSQLARVVDRTPA